MLKNAILRLKSLFFCAQGIEASWRSLIPISFSLFSLKFVKKNRESVSVNLVNFVKK